MNGTTGELIWKYTANYWVETAPAIGSDGTIYFGSYDNNTYALNGKTGELIWKYETGNNIISSPAIGSDGTIYIGSNDHNVYALNGKNRRFDLEIYNW